MCQRYTSAILTTGHANAHLYTYIIARVPTTSILEGFLRSLFFFWLIRFHLLILFALFFFFAGVIRVFRFRYFRWLNVWKELITITPHSSTFITAWRLICWETCYQKQGSQLIVYLCYWTLLTFWINSCLLKYKDNSSLCSLFMHPDAPCLSSFSSPSLS